MSRPRSITVVAWIFIVDGAAGLLKDLAPLLLYLLFRRASEPYFHPEQH